MNNDDPFIRYLRTLRHENTGTLAALRRACGQRLAESRNCQDFASVSTRPADFLTVTLVAQYPTDDIKKGKHAQAYPYRGSIGAAWARYCRERNPERDPATFYAKRQNDLAGGRPTESIPSIHERFRTLLDAELEVDGTGELAYRLRGLVRMCVMADIPIDAIQLAYDLRGWRAESHYVQERWAKAFYSPPRLEDKGSEQPAASDNETTESEIEIEEDDNVD